MSSSGFMQPHGSERTMEAAGAGPRTQSSKREREYTNSKSEAEVRKSTAGVGGSAVKTQNVGDQNHK